MIKSEEGEYINPDGDEHKFAKTIFVDILGNVLIYKWTSNGTSSVELLENAVALRFIGRKDKNNEEIYEHDIVRDDNGFLTIVKYVLQDVDAFEGIGFNLWSFMEGTEPDGKRLQRTFEVVGNIYENLELLEEITEE